MKMRITEVYRGLGWLWICLLHSEICSVDTSFHVFYLFKEEKRNYQGDGHVLCCSSRLSRSAQTNLQAKIRDTAMGQTMGTISGGQEWPKQMLRSKSITKWSAWPMCLLLLSQNGLVFSKVIKLTIQVGQWAAALSTFPWLYFEWF